MTISPKPPRFGVWALNTGTWASHAHPDDPVDASWRRVRDQIVRAEQLGYDATLVAQHTIHPMGDEYAYLEAWSSAAALAAITSRIEIITAIKPPLCHPAILAKQALGIEEISEGRFSINIVNGWFKPELEDTGIGLLPHDERYAYGSEWLEVVRSLFERPRTSFTGQYFQIDNVSLNPRSPYRRRPKIYVGGESEPARDLAAGQADTWFINGQPLHEVESLIASVRARPRGDLPPVTFGLSAYVIARETREEAEEELARAWRLANAESDALAGMLGKIDPKAQMFKTAAKYPHVGTNGGTAAGLVGSYDEVAARIDEFHRAGIDLFMLQFQPFEAETERFAREIFPRVRQTVAA